MDKKQRFEKPTRKGVGIIFYSLMALLILLIIGICWQGSIIKRIKAPFIEVELDEKKPTKEIKPDQAKDITEKDRTPRPGPSINIEQHTKGDQSPAVVSGGNVKIDIESKQGKKKND